MLGKSVKPIFHVVPALVLEMVTEKPLLPMRHARISPSRRAGGPPHWHQTVGVVALATTWVLANWSPKRWPWVMNITSSPT